ncbi:hypothetical protein [Mesorhizobium sp. B2-3-10]|nr:hypothetical protein [Mesorhizobium sp. B2-3-10]
MNNESNTPQPPPVTQEEALASLERTLAAIVARTAELRARRAKK